ncbi:MAG TPA: hypothetical protein VK629_05410 [Steroidobacteraceae bacterium]|nr:hypothetical protein [Steroidobacteraceae bacterium]
MDAFSIVTLLKAMHGWRMACVAVAAIVASACTTVPYQHGTGRIAQDGPLSPPMKQQFLYGKPNTFLDAADWYWPESLLGKLILWNKNIDSHQISPETIEAMQQYVAVNDLSNVQILVNGYYPGNQWQRLFKNKMVGKGWRFTFGILSVVGYTILPGRFFGGDAYNPYTHTIYLYSDEAAIALHEAGHSKDFGSRKHKGLHAALYQLPLVSLYYEAKASSDALSYARCNVELRKDAYKLLYPAWSTYVGGNIGRFDENLLWNLSVIPGHIVGRIRAANVEPCQPGEASPVATAAPLEAMLDLLADEEPGIASGHDVGDDPGLDDPGLDDPGLETSSSEPKTEPTLQ